MTRPPSPESARRAVESSAKQGLPPTITDGPTLDRLAALIRTYTPKKPAKKKPRRRKATET